MHRLVAEYFIPNEDAKKIYVNHIDGNTENNNVENLEWVTPKENTTHAIKTGLMKCANKEQMDKIRKIFVSKYSIPIIKKDLQGNVLEEFSSASEIQSKYNYSKANILKCCRKIKSYNTAYCYIW